MVIYKTEIATPKMTSNTLPQGRAFASSSYGTGYEAFRCFDQIDNNEGWVTPTGIKTGYIGYEFNSPICISKYILRSSLSAYNETPKDWTFEGSNDNLTWEILDTQINQIWSANLTEKEYFIVNQTKYKSYRLNITANNGNGSYLGLNELKMYERDIQKLYLLKSNNKTYSLESFNTWYETKMTSNTAPAPFEASASSIYNSTFNAWKAFNGTNVSNQDCWVTPNNIVNGWIQLNFGRNVKVNTVKLTSRFGGYETQSPKRFQILGSNDGISFDLLTEFNNQKNWITNETRKFIFFNEKEYQYYRINILENNGGIAVSIGEILFSYESNYANELPSTKTSNFIKYGNEKIEDTNVIFHNKNYILQDTVSENSEGLWTTQLTRKPLSIKFE